MSRGLPVPYALGGGDDTHVLVPGSTPKVHAAKRPKALQGFRGLWGARGQSRAPWGAEVGPPRCGRMLDA